MGPRRKPYRYRWPDDIRDEVLARLLELNAERAAEEARTRTAASAGRPMTECWRPRTADRRPRAPGRTEVRPLWGSPDD